MPMDKMKPKLCVSIATDEELGKDSEYVSELLLAVGNHLGFHCTYGIETCKLGSVYWAMFLRWLMVIDGRVVVEEMEEEKREEREGEREEEREEREGEREEERERSRLEEELVSNCRVLRG